MRRSLQYTGVAAVVTVWATLLAATAVSGFDLLGEDPISYLGSESRSAALFTVGLAIPALLLTAFHQYVRGRYPVSAGFSLVMLVGLAGQMVAAFAPIGGDPAVHRIHTTSALILGVSLPLLMWRFAAAQPRGPWRRLAYGLFWAEAVACVVGLYLSARMVAPVAEILPGSVFHVWVVVLTFATVRASHSPSSPSRRCPHPLVTNVVGNAGGPAGPCVAHLGHGGEQAGRDGAAGDDHGDVLGADRPVHPGQHAVLQLPTASVETGRHQRRREALGVEQAHKSRSGERRDANVTSAASAIMTPPGRSNLEPSTRKRRGSSKPVGPPSAKIRRSDPPPDGTHGVLAATRSKVPRRNPRATSARHASIR